MLPRSLRGWTKTLKHIGENLLIGPIGSLIILGLLVERSKQGHTLRCVFSYAAMSYVLEAICAATSDVWIVYTGLSDLVVFRC